MNKRCIVNVATGEFYCKMQERLIKSFAPSCNVYKKTKDGYWTTPKWHDKKIDLLCWRDCFPEGSRSHEESPYGFKVFAIKSAFEKGYTSILWIDSPGYAVKEDISPIFEKIEKEGYYAMSHIDPLENWVGEFTLAHFAMRRDLLKGYNLPSGSCYGFDFSKPHIETLFDSMCTKERQGFFNSETISEGGWHRHDESVLAMLLIQFGLPIFTHDPLFQSTDPSCVIRSGELLDLTPNI
jgi:hypothetical protein